MATRIVVMKDGLIQQVDTPQQLYDNPCNMFVAGFIGTPQMNFLNATLSKKGDNVSATIGSNEFKLPAEKAANEALQEYIGKEVIVGIRPECVRDDEQGIQLYGQDWGCTAQVDVKEDMGAETYLYLTLDETPVIGRISGRSSAISGESHKIAFNMNLAHIFDKDTEKCICH